MPQLHLMAHSILAVYVAICMPGVLHLPVDAQQVRLCQNARGEMQDVTSLLCCKIVQLKALCNLLCLIQLANLLASCMLPAGEHKGRDVGNIHSSFLNHYSRGSRGCRLHCWSQCQLAHQLNPPPSHCGDHHGSHCWSDPILHVSSISFNDRSPPLV